MKKGAKGRKFHRKRDQRQAFLKSLAEALVQHEKIETTEARAKELRPYIEHYVTKSRVKSVASARDLETVFTKDSAKKLLEDIGPRFKNRTGGYTRIVKRGFRKKDAAKRAVISFVEESKQVEK